MKFYVGKVLKKLELKGTDNLSIWNLSAWGKDFLDRIGHALNIYHTQYYTDELTDTIFFATQQKYAGVNTSSNSTYNFFMTFRVLTPKQRAVRSLSQCGSAVAWGNQ